MKSTCQGMPEGIALLRYAHEALAHVSYLLADARSATAAVIDPCGDPEVYLEDSWRLGAKIKHVFLTQLHDDFPSDYLDLHDRTSATVYVGAWAGSNPLWMPLKQGDAFEFGRVGLRILETPGHRLESIVILVHDLSSNDPNPIAALTGETVLLGDFGRPAPRPEDGYGVEELAAMLHQSLQRKVLVLPDETRIFPSHTGRLEPAVGSADTLRVQKRVNPGLQPMPCDEFVPRVTGGMTRPAFPESNGENHLFAASLDQILRAQRGGAQIVDDRDPADFAEAHLDRSINLPAAADVERWGGTILDRQRPVMMVSVPGREKATAARLRRMGFPDVAGFLEGGIQRIEDRPQLLRHFPRVSYPDLGTKLLNGKQFLLLDTRDRREGTAGPSFCAYPAPLSRLALEVRSLPRGPEIIVCDDTPYRSTAAASFLRERGFENVAIVAGGLALWGR